MTGCVQTCSGDFTTKAFLILPVDFMSMMDSMEVLRDISVTAGLLISDKQ